MGQAAVKVLADHCPKDGISQELKPLIAMQWIVREGTMCEGLFQEVEILEGVT
jgi:hypothetical protein